MIRILLIALGGWAAWRYRSQVRGYVEDHLPHVLPHGRARTAEGLGEAKAGLGHEGKAER
jgi:hypothetical protein